MSSSWRKMKEARQTGRKEQQLLQGFREDCAYLSGSAELSGLCQRQSQDTVKAINEWTMLIGSLNSCHHEHRGQIYDGKEGCHRSYQISSSSFRSLETLLHPSTLLLHHQTSIVERKSIFGPYQPSWLLSRSATQHRIYLSYSHLVNSPSTKSLASNSGLDSPVLLGLTIMVFAIMRSCICLIPWTKPLI